MELTRQLFDIQNTFGKTPEQLKTLMMAMVQDLNGYSPQDVQNAFLRWRRMCSTIPTPADILNLLRPVENEFTPSIPRENPEERRSDYKDLTPQEKENLKKLLKRAQEAIKNGYVLERSAKAAGSWVGKHWNDYTQEDHNALDNHFFALAKLKGEDCLQEYKFFLRDFCGMPEWRF